MILPDDATPKPDGIFGKDNARWTKKNDESFSGYKNHLGVDKAHKLIRKWDATDAAVHDSQKLNDVLDLSNTGKEVWAVDLPAALQTFCKRIAKHGAAQGSTRPAIGAEFRRQFNTGKH